MSRDLTGLSSRPLGFRLPRSGRCGCVSPLAYGALFLVSGAVLLAVTYVLFRYTFYDASIHRYSFRTPGARLPGHQLPGLPSPQAQDARQHSADLHQLLIVSGIALAVTAATSIVVGWLVAGRALRPLRTITASARDISATDLDRRIALDGPDDELKELGDTFDALLVRLQHSFDSQRQFVANASHELRTPLTLEQALLEAVLMDPDATADSFRATCERLLMTSKQQDRLIEALLTLARERRRPPAIDVGRPLGNCRRRASVGTAPGRQARSASPCRHDTQSHLWRSPSHRTPRHQPRGQRHSLQPARR